MSLTGSEIALIRLLVPMLINGAFNLAEQAGMRDDEIEKEFQAEMARFKERDPADLPDV